ncbi:MAG: hypothetical protein H0W69_07105 [Gemmatimonadaceae bacterium]|nr:hypothetical protein [Gemmatimonadaceae bacterium]
MAGEPFAPSSDPPILRVAEILEGGEMRAIPVERDPAVEEGFAAFLDGSQRVQVIAQEAGIPIVLGTVSAAIRVRVERRMQSWGRRPPVLERRLYLPFAYLESAATDAAIPFQLVDTSEADYNGVIPSQHPASLMERAVKKVQEDRERAELALAEAWCQSESGALFIDGGIGGSGAVATSSLAVGVVKSHRTLHADGDALRTVLRLGVAERSPVFRVTSRSRTSVASWYLRIRSADARDAMWGLVRIEAPEGGWSTERADEISRWVLRESSPLSLPDHRWDKMAYGVRDTEEFLRAIS